jgi:dTDP-4-dehydrorhamnose 3,5-epimerase
LVDGEKKADDRGYFIRSFCSEEFENKGLNSSWLQMNMSMSECSGTLRGLHFQKTPACEVKLVRCIKGAIWDVVVDLRKNSKTFGSWYGATLSADNMTAMYVPEGLAHGFITLENYSEVQYLVSEFYQPQYEETLLWNDPQIAIKWPLEPTSISQKDIAGKRLHDIDPINSKLEK